MNVRLVFALFSLLLFGAPVYAQSPCSDCLKAADVELKQCRGTAISAGDKISCEERRQAQMKACGNGVCKMERDEVDKRDHRSEQQMPNRPGLTPYTPTKIEWLALAVNSQLQYERHAEDLYEVYVVQADHETLEILVRDHLGRSSRQRSTTKLAIMKSKIKTTRELIMATARRYGWENWIRIREPVEVSPR
jgi:hypothetical protein